MGELECICCLRGADEGGSGEGDNKVIFVSRESRYVDFCETLMGEMGIGNEEFLCKYSHPRLESCMIPVRCDPTLMAMFKSHGDLPCKLFIELGANWRKGCGRETPSMDEGNNTGGKNVDLVLLVSISGVNRNSPEVDIHVSEPENESLCGVQSRRVVVSNNGVEEVNIDKGPPVDGHVVDGICGVEGFGIASSTGGEEHGVVGLDRRIHDAAVLTEIANCPGLDDIEIGELFSVEVGGIGTSTVGEDNNAAEGDFEYSFDIGIEDLEDFWQGITNYGDEDAEENVRLNNGLQSVESYNRTEVVTRDRRSGSEVGVNSLHEDDFDVFSEYDGEERVVELEERFQVGGIFCSVEEFKQLLHEYSLRKRFNPKYISNKRRWYCLECKHDRCPWKVTAGCVKNGDTVVVNHFTPHEHSTQDLLSFKPRVMAKYIGMMCRKRIKDDRDRWNPLKIVDELDDKFKVKLSYTKAWRAHEEAKFLIQGRPEEGYLHVAWMCKILKEEILGTIAEFRISKCSPK